MSRVLVTGGSGFIGKHCLPRLIARGHEVHAVTRHPGPSIPGVTWHVVDLFDTSAVVAMLHDLEASHLLHLAWDTTPGLYWSAPANLDWMLASVRLIELFGQSGGKHAVVASTCAEYAPTDAPCTEDQTPIAPSSLYGAAKASLALLLRAVAPNVGIQSLTWARIFHVYGPGEASRRLIPSVLRAVTSGATMACTEGTQIRDFVYVEDVAEALAGLLDKELNGPVNVATGHGVSVRDMLTTIANTVQRGHLLRFGARPVAVGDPRYLVGSTQRLHEILGWTPSTSIAAGARRTSDAWQLEQSHA